MPSRLRKIVVTVLMAPDDEDNMPAIPALRHAIEQMALNPGESIESIVEVEEASTSMIENTPTGDWLWCSPEALALNPEPVIGYDLPLANGCFKCIGCGRILPKRRDWNQCASCDVREPEER